MLEFFTRRHTLKGRPPYLHRLEEFPRLEIVRLKGRLDHDTIPLVESRIEENRKHGGKIEKNVILDFAKVEHVDSALIASHMVHLSEYQSQGFTIAMINVTTELKNLIDLFHKKDAFKIYANEEDAVKELNQ